MKGYDYASAGAYFVTLVAYERACLFGAVVNGATRLNDCGRVVETAWNELPRHFSNVALDAFVVMPNHVHAIIVITDDARRGGVSPPSMDAYADQGGMTPPLRKPTLGQIVAFFKYQTTKRINEQRGTPAARVWQRDYFERVVRDENEMNRLREYIVNNPLRWETDEENSMTPADSS